MNKYIYVAIGIFIAGLITALVYYKKSYENALKEIAELNMVNEFQNAKIKEFEIATYTFNNKLDDLNRKLNKRYEKINTKKLDTCEVELQELKEVMKIFYSR